MDKLLIPLLQFVELVDVLGNRRPRELNVYLLLVRNRKLVVCLLSYILIVSFLRQIKRSRLLKVPLDVLLLLALAGGTARDPVKQA